MLGSDEPGFTAQIEHCVSYLSKNFTREIENQKDMLTRRRPGVHIIDDRFPTFILVEMHNRPFQRDDFAQSVCNKLNRGINEMATREKNVRVMDISRSLSFREHFDLWGKLNYNGKLRFWHAIDSQLEQFVNAGYRGLDPRYYSRIPAAMAPAAISANEPNHSARHVAQPDDCVRGRDRNRGDRAREDRDFEQRRRNRAWYQDNRVHHTSSSQRNADSPLARVSLFERFQPDFNRDHNDHHDCFETLFNCLLVAN